MLCYRGIGIARCYQVVQLFYGESCDQSWQDVTQLDFTGYERLRSRIATPSVTGAVKETTSAYYGRALSSTSSMWQVFQTSSLKLHRKDIKPCSWCNIFVHDSSLTVRKRTRRKISILHFNRYSSMCNQTSTSADTTSACNRRSGHHLHQSALNSTYRGFESRSPFQVVPSDPTAA